MNYKIGDTIRVAKTNTYNDFRNGQIGKINKINKNGALYDIEFKTLEYGFYHSWITEVEPVKQEFEKGDTVKRIKGDFNGMEVGDVATVKNVGLHSIELEEFGDGFTHEPNNFELIHKCNGGKKMETEFEMGDRVKILGLNKLCLGTIRTITANGDCHIERDDGVTGGGREHNGRACWIGHESDLEKINGGETKMNKPETQLEKNALEEAKKDVVKAQIESKATDYKESMRSFISLEKDARSYRKRADELKELLGITEKEMKELF